jgi:hypothetical protein
MALGSTNITISDIKDELGEDTYVLSELCTSPNVNMFSKFKPVASEGTTDWWRGSDGFYSLTIPSITDPDDVDTTTWTYNPPTGGSSSPYKMGHFRLYLHEATPPLTLGADTGETINLFSTSSITFVPTGISLSSDDDEASGISLDDISNFSDYYLACQVTNESGTEVIGTSTTQGSGGTITINFNTLPFSQSVWQDQTLTFRFFLSDTYKAFSDSAVSATYYALYREDGVYDTVHTRVIDEYNTIDADFTSVRTSYYTEWQDIVSIIVSGDDTAGTIYNSGQCEFLIDFSSEDGEDHTISGTAWDIEVNPTFPGDSWSGNLNAYMYNTSGTQITTLTVDGTTGAQAIIKGYFMLYDSSGTAITPTSGTQYTSTIKITYNGTTVGSVVAIFYAQ